MKKAFTLIELLVVIAIIAILAAILFPVFAQAKLAAKKTQDLSNMKNIGTCMQLYLADNDDTYAHAYNYKDNAGDTNGYVQWTAMHYPYIKSIDIFVSPADPNKGLVPTNPACSSISQFEIGTGPACDAQVPHLSYTVNAVLMPRKRKTNDPAVVVNATSVDKIAGTILVAPFSDTAACVNDTSQNQTTTTYKNKSHRPTNALMQNATGGKWAGDNVTDHTDTTVFAATPAIANEAWTFCATGADSSSRIHLKYIAPRRFGNGSNFAFADTHAKFFSTDATLNPSNFMWGRSVYSASGQPVLKQDGVTQVD